MITTERIEWLLAPAYSGGLATRPLDELRSMGEECRDVETAVSYYRRLAQGRIEILRAEEERRASGGSVEELIADLPRILAGEGGRSGTTQSRVAPPDATIGELVWRDGEERLVADETLANLPTLDESALTAALERLAAFERELSDVRRRLHRVIDAVEGEIATRQAADVG